MPATRTPRWSDGLARRVARRSGGAPTPPRRDGLTRRTVLQTAAATAVAGSALARVSPAFADDQQVACRKVQATVAKNEYRMCIAGPNSAYVHAANAIDHALNALKVAKGKAAHDRLLQIIDQATAIENRAVKDFVDCGTSYQNAILDGNVYCGGSPDAPGANTVTRNPNGTPTATDNSCPPGTHGCVGSPTCCYGDNACCSCSTGITCCIYADCRCCPQ
jgi:hypothetical protein